MPVLTRFPPVGASYHFNVPVPVAFSVTVPVPQREAPVVVGALGIVMVM